MDQNKWFVITDRTSVNYGHPGYVVGSGFGSGAVRIMVKERATGSVMMEMHSEQLKFISQDEYLDICKQYFERKNDMKSGLSESDKKSIKEYCEMDVAITNELFFSNRVTPKKVIYNQDNLTTTVLWQDGTTTIVRCSRDDEFSEYNGFIAALAKKIYGGTGAIRRAIDDTKSYQSCKKKKKNTNPLENAMKDNLQGRL